MKITLIGCVKSKLNVKSKVETLYISDFFKKSLAYARAINSDKIFILSAKYGLVELNDEIEPYELSLFSLKKSQRIEWTNNVIDSLNQKTNLDEDEFILLAGFTYRQFLIEHLNNYKCPLSHLTFCRQLKWLRIETLKEQAK